MNDNNNVYIGDDGISPISDFYRGKTVLLTGVTGFLGECFLVKLLRCILFYIKLLEPDRRRPILLLKNSHRKLENGDDMMI